MIKCHLSSLMGKNKLNIQDVHEKTGLSRNTISAVYHEKAKGMEFETIEKLCRLFNCEIGELLELAD